LDVLASNDAIPALRAAIVLLLSGEQQRAAEMLAVLPSDGAGDARLGGALGFIAYLRREGELAVRLLERAVELDPDDANNLALLAASYLGVERHAQALDAFRGALRLDPALHVAQTLAWSAIAGSGRLDGALRALKAALLDEPQCAPAPAASKTRVEHTTLCIVDCQNHALAERALRLCMAGCAFDQVKWLTDRPIAVPGVQTVVIPPIRSAAEYSRFLIKDLLPHIDTEYALVVQWDGYVVNPQAWSPEFLLFDYIGARWDTQESSATGPRTVGNGGFSLRSRALLQALQDPAIKPLHPEDAAICRIYRGYLEDRHEIVFAPEGVADRFSFEHIEQATLPFGFHGVTNLARFAAAPRIATLDFLFDGPERQAAQRLGQ
jgi:tetratricopeptide (TPR) repeat protein